MYLRNFDNHLICLTSFTLSASSTSNYYNDFNSEHGINVSNGFMDGAISRKTTDGTVSAVKIGVASSYYDYLNTPLRCASSQICLGTGTTPVTYDDYKLSGDVIDNTILVYNSDSYTFDSENNKYKKSVTFTYTNSTDENITIGEWGFFIKNSTASGTLFDNNSANHVLMFREILDSPVVIEVGTTATLTFEIEFPMLHR